MNLNLFIQEIKSKKLTLMSTDEWKVKDVLCHLVFWHENYAANYHALATHQEPPLFNAPGYKLNKQGVAMLRKLPMETLIKRLENAQKILYLTIVELKVPQMIYKKMDIFIKVKIFYVSSLDTSSHK